MGLLFCYPIIRRRYALASANTKLQRAIRCLRKDNLSSAKKMNCYNAHMNYRMFFTRLLISLFVVVPGVALAQQHPETAQRARAPATASRIDPAARMWFSFSITASNSPMRWLTPPPTRTAYFCAWRRPGRVLRVSSICARVLATAAT